MSKELKVTEEQTEKYFSVADDMREFVINMRAYMSSVIREEPSEEVKLDARTVMHLESMKIAIEAALLVHDTITKEKIDE